MTDGWPIECPPVNDARSGRAYRAYPAHATRWLLPSEPRLHAAGARAYLPTRRRGLLRRWAIQARFGGRTIYLAADALQRLETSLGATIGATVPVRAAFHLGTPSAFRKTTLQALGEAGHTLAFAKLAGLPLAREAIRREVAILAELAADDAVGRHVPAVYGTWHDGDALGFAMTAAPERAGPRRYGRPHAHFLATIHGRFGERRPLSTTATMHDVRERRERRDAMLSDAWRDRYDRALDRLETSAEREVATSVAHRDFAPWNTRLTPDGTLVAFDWEFARRGGLVACDRFQFAFLNRLHLERPPDAEWAAQLLGRVRREPEAERFDLGPTTFLAFLLDLGLAYHEMLFARDGHEEDAVLRSVASLLDQTSRWGGP